MRFTGSYTDYPILRPLVGTDKEETIKIARSLGTYEVSIRPFEDCCVLFAAKHPIIKADFDAEREEFLRMGYLEAVEEAMGKAETINLPFSIKPRPEP
jgi:thiamine biosynthesis protein ThiI